MMSSLHVCGNIATSSASFGLCVGLIVGQISLQSTKGDRQHFDDRVIAQVLHRAFCTCCMYPLISITLLCSSVIQFGYRDYEGITTVTPKLKDSKDTKTTNQSNQTIDKISGQTAIKISLRTAGIILISIVLLTCCCTLFIRNRLANLFNKVRRKKRKSKLIPIETENITNVSKSYFARKPRLKRKRAPSYEMVHTATQNDIVAVSKEPEEPPPTGCYKCYKKKRKKTGKRAYR